MNITLVEILFWVILIPNIIVLGVTLVNLITAPVMRNIFTASENTPFVSILIPARNEEENIYNNVWSALQQSYTNFELIVLDDNSTDTTHEILSEFAAYNDNLKLLKGKPLPDNWLGKNYACHQLAQEAKGEILLFIDADVTLSKHSLSYAVNLFLEEKLDMLSSFPSQKFSGFGQRFVVPMMNWVLLTFLPLRLVSKSPDPKFAAANGQFIMFKKDVYQSVGGHESVRSEVVEDMAFAKKLKSKSKTVKTVLGGDAVSCTMYKDFNSAVNGFSKNFFPGFGLSASLFILLLISFLILFLLPFGLLPLRGFDIIAGIILLQRIFISIPSRQNILQNSLLHPFQMIILFYVGITSVVKTLTGKVEWKSRKV